MFYIDSRRFSFAGKIYFGLKYCSKPHIIFTYDCWRYLIMWEAEMLLNQAIQFPKCERLMNNKSLFHCFNEGNCAGGHQSIKLEGIKVRLIKIVSRACIIPV